MNLSKAAKKIVALSAIIAGAAFAHGQATINIIGLAVADNGGTPLADGRLIQVIASTIDSTFSAPSPTAFASGDDVVIASFALNSATLSIAGSFQQQLTINSSAFTNLGAGDKLLLRWFDTPYSLIQGAPGAVYFGQFQGVAGVDNSDAWEMPGPGGSILLNFVTTDYSGSQSVASSYASLSTSAIPEPSTYAAIFGAAVLGFAAYRRRSAAQR